MDSLEQYLEKHQYQKQLDNLAKKFRNKKVVIHGYGTLFKLIEKKYDLTRFNIVGIMDKKFSKFNNNDFPTNYTYIKLDNLYRYDFDFVLIATENYLPIIKELKKITNKKIYPLIKKTFSELANYQAHRLLTHKNNTVVLVKRDGKKVLNPKIKNLKLKLSGKDNYIEIHEPLKIKKELYISCLCNNSIVIDRNNKYDVCRLYLGSNNKILIGKDTTIENADLITKNSSNTQINIGDDCMISYNVKIRTNDGHTIYDNSTKEILNHAQNITIGNHVWIAANTTILKGIEIPANCIIANSAMVSRKFTKENCIIAGNPAQIVKENVNWTREYCN